MRSPQAVTAGGLLTLLLTPLLLGFLMRPGPVHADITPGVDWYARNAEPIALVRAQTALEAQLDPPPEGKQRLLVEEVLKGLLTRSSVLLDAGKLAPERRGVVLFQYEPPVHLEPAVAMKRDKPTAVALWPLVGQSLDTGGLPLKTGGFGEGGADLTLPNLRAIVTRVAPEEARLQEQMLWALLQPEKFRTLAGDDPGRARYVQFALAVRDLGRDVPALADLIESSDAAVAAAADDRLRALTAGAGLRPEDVASPSKRQAAEKWRRWWNAHRAALTWDEAKGAYAARGEGAPNPRRWPEIPADDLDAVLPPALIESLIKPNPGAFAAAFRSWLDSGVLRDRLIGDSRSIDQRLLDENSVAGANYYLPAAPRLRPEMLFDADIPAENRIKVVALVASCWHFDRFAADRARAAEYLGATSNAEDIRRAAFWEMRSSSFETPGRVALRRLAHADDAASQDLMARLFFAGIHDDMFDAARIAIRAGHERFIDALLDRVRTNRDESAQCAGKLLCLEKRPAVLDPLLPWLKDPDPAARAAAAHSLCWLPCAQAVPALLDAVADEKDRTARSAMRVALAQTGDKRALDALLTAVNDDPQLYQVARGLARIGDPAALPALAKLARKGQETKDLQLTSEAVEAFGRVSGRFRAPAPADYYSGSGIDPKLIEEGLASIEAWEKERATTREAP